MTEPAPLILTLAMDERSFRFFDEQRKRHFPPERNFIPAHLTLFHKLPAEQYNHIADDVAAAVNAQPAFALNVSGLRSLGRGVAYVVESPTLATFRRALAVKWALWLTLQDRQKHQPHITVQNKVTPDVAGTLLTSLGQHFAPFTIRAEGVSLWRYLGGPWQHIETFPFTRKP